MTFLQSLIDGIGLGAVYAVVGVGIGLVFGVMRLVNFAYGELITAGGYTLAMLSGAPGIVAIAACFAVVVALSLLQERVAFRPLRGASPATMLIATFAVSFLLQNVYLLAFGSRGSTVGTLGGLNTAIAGILAASVAVLLTVQSPLVTPAYGVSVTIFALVGVVVGGLDRLLTASLGGFAIGFATAFVGDLLPSSGSVYLPSVVYGLVILVILLRPSGLFAGRRATAAERV